MEHGHSRESTNASPCPTGIASWQLVQYIHVICFYICFYTGHGPIIFCILFFLHPPVEDIATVSTFSMVQGSAKHAADPILEHSLDCNSLRSKKQMLPNRHAPLKFHKSTDGQTSQMTVGYILWPSASSFDSGAEERAAYFCRLERQVETGTAETMPRQASTLLDLMTIRAFHSKLLRRYGLGTALGFRIKDGELTGLPAIIVFVAHKIRAPWLQATLILPRILKGPGGIWCDVDVVEFSYEGPHTMAARNFVFTDLVEKLRGNDHDLGSGSQVASRKTYGSLGGIVRSQIGTKTVGFLTNRHVAVDLDYPNQKMFHPFPPNLGPGMYLGDVERATCFITDILWYGVFASTNPETFVRADGAFIPFVDNFDMSRISTAVKSVGEIGDVMHVNLQDTVESIIGKHVVKVGRSSGLTEGTIAGYAVEYNNENGICLFTDFLVIGENGQAFDVEGDSGSLIILLGEEGEKPRPIGVVWRGTENQGRLKVKNGDEPENWTSGMDLGRLLGLLQLDLIINDRDLENPLSQKCPSDGAQN